MKPKQMYIVGILGVILIAIIYLIFSNNISTTPDTNTQQAPLVFERETDKATVKEANLVDYPESRLSVDATESLFIIDPFELINETDFSYKQGSQSQTEISYQTNLSADEFIAQAVSTVPDGFALTQFVSGDLTVLDITSQTENIIVSINDQSDKVLINVTIIK